MTNNHWRFDSEEVRRRFGWGAFKVINDFTAMALGVPHVSADKLVHVCGGPGNAARPGWLSVRVPAWECRGWFRCSMAGCR